MMTERTLNRLILAAFALLVVSHGATLSGVLSGVVPANFLGWVTAITFGLGPLFVMMKVISGIFLSGIKGQSLDLIEQMYIVCYLFFTAEARDEWRRYIDELSRQEG